LGGFLITFEGIEGSGKSTQSAILAERLSREGLPFAASREPGGTALCRGLRSLLLEERASGEKWCMDAEMLLFCADRAQHLDTVVMPALREGRIVVLDRFEDSTWAYQGAQGAKEKTLAELSKIVAKGLRPDLTLLLDADPAAALRRATVRNGSAEGFSETRFDHEGLDFHGKVRERFLGIASREPGRVVVVGAGADPAGVAERIWSEVAPRLSAAGFPLGGAHVR
jgi:dTMP kinase